MIMIKKLAEELGVHKTTLMVRSKKMGISTKIGIALDPRGAIRDQLCVEDDDADKLREIYKMRINK